MEKTIKLTLEQAREMLGKDKAMDALIRANFTEQELQPRVTKWEDLGRISGFYLGANSKIKRSEIGMNSPENKNVFAKKTQAEGVLAMAQLSQLMADVNGDWKPDWKNKDIVKYVIQQYFGKSCANIVFGTEEFLAFPTSEIRDQFLEDHRELIETYFKIYE